MPTSATHEPSFVPSRDDDGTFASTVACACGAFERTARSAASASAARGNARRQFNRHRVRALAEPDVEAAGDPVVEPGEESVSRTLRVAQARRVSVPAVPAVAAVPAPVVIGAEPPVSRRRVTAPVAAVAVLAVLVVVLAVTAIAGRGDPSSASSTQEAQAAQAVVQRACAGWRWDAGEGLAANDARLTQVAGQPLDPTLHSRMLDLCPGRLTQYDAAVVAEMRRPTATSTEAPATLGVGGSLLRHDVTAAEVRALAHAADRYGYANDHGHRFSYSQAYDFAALTVSTCLSIRAGYSTWAEQVNEAVADGNRRRLVVDMVRYEAGVFCPGVR